MSRIEKATGQLSARRNAATQGGELQPPGLSTRPRLLPTRPVQAAPPSAAGHAPQRSIARIHTCECRWRELPRREPDYMVSKRAGDACAGGLNDLHTSGCPVRRPL
eukprot:5543959-Prymnesium_polylepis.2